MCPPHTQSVPNGRCAMNGSFQNLMLTKCAELRPENSPFVGMGATIVRWTDRHAATVVEVSKSGKTIVVRMDKATRVDGLGMTDAQQYTFEPDPNGGRYTVRLTKRGWRVRGGGPTVLLGKRSHYYDFTF